MTEYYPIFTLSIILLDDILGTSKLDTPEILNKKIPDSIVFLLLALVTILASIGIYYISSRIEVGIGWLISLFAILLAIENIPRTKPYGTPIRFGMAMGVFISWAIVYWVLM